MIPHFALPFRVLGSKGAAVNDQDSEPEILSCVEAIVRYETGTRPEKPEFGIPSPIFASPLVDEGSIQAAINRWEPRINTTVSHPEVDGLVQSITVGGDR